MYSAFIKVSGEDKEQVEHYAESVEAMLGGSFAAIRDGIEITVVKEDEITLAS